MREREFLLAELKREFFILLAGKVHIGSAFADFNRRSLTAGVSQHERRECDRAVRSETNGATVLELHFGAPGPARAKPSALNHWQIDHGLLKVLRGAVRDLHTALNETQAYSSHL